MAPIPFSWSLMQLSVLWEPRREKEVGVEVTEVGKNRDVVSRGESPQGNAGELGRGAGQQGRSRKPQQQVEK